MTRPCPYTPLSTPLSGSARQAEARIRNLFQGQKRRPPVWLMALTLLLIFSCGGLVTCRTAASPPPEEGAPVFSLTTPGEESVPFSDLLGFSGTAIHTVREDLSDWYEYQIRLPDGTSFSLADTSGLMYHLDLDGDGHPDLLAHDPDGGQTSSTFGGCGPTAPSAPRICARRRLSCWAWRAPPGSWSP